MDCLEAKFTIPPHLSRLQTSSTNWGLPSVSHQFLLIVLRHFNSSLRQNCDIEILTTSEALIDNQVFNKGHGFVRGVSCSALLQF